MEAKKEQKMQQSRWAAAAWNGQVVLRQNGTLSPPCWNEMGRGYGSG